MKQKIIVYFMKKKIVLLTKQLKMSSTCVGIRLVFLGIFVFKKNAAGILTVLCMRTKYIRRYFQLENSRYI